MKKKTINLLILNLTITAGIWGAYFYMIHHINVTDTSFGDLKHKISFEIKKQQAVDNLRNKIKENFKAGFDLNDFIVNPNQTADVVQTIESFGAMTGTKVSTQSVATEDAIGFPSGVDFLKIIFNIEGQKENVLSGIRLVENLPYNIKINRLAFSKSTDASSTVKWTANIDLILIKLSDSDASSTEQ